MEIMSIYSTPKHTVVVVMKVWGYLLSFQKKVHISRLGRLLLIKIPLSNARLAAMVEDFQQSLMRKVYIGIWGCLLVIRIPLGEARLGAMVEKSQH